jgi:hypothetical protein
MSAGKGDKPRNCFSKKYKSNYEHINWGSDDSSKEKICPTCKDVLSSSLKACRSCGYELK